jgi:hypothetical protein
MKNPPFVLQMVIRVLGVIVLGLGIVLFTTRYHGDAHVYNIHELLGVLLVLALWALAWFAFKARVSIALVAAAVAWGLIAPILGFAQLNIDGGNSHPVEVVHLLVGLGVIAFGEVLGARIKRAA